MGNAIAATSELDSQLIEAYEIDGRYSRFCACYDIVDQAEYKEINYAIALLKEFEGTPDGSEIELKGLGDLVTILKTLFASKEIRRKAYLLDILEEARERKRP